ncbi:MAG: ABC transporter permease [Bryobacteraceae bacterium]
MLELPKADCLVRLLGTLLFRRLVHGLLVLLVASLLAFTLASIAPGDYFDDMWVNPAISPQTLARLRSQYALDRPFAERYLQWITSIPKGQWGFSFAYNSPAGPILLSRGGNTLLLTGVATLLAWLVALVWGGWAATNEGGFFDVLLTSVNALLLAIPEVVLALSLMVFAVRTGYFPLGGLASNQNISSGMWSQTRDLASHLVLPSIALAAGSAPLLLSHVRTAVSEALHSSFIEAAWGHGISRSRMLLRHAFPAAANPLITLFGTSVGMLISSSLLTEAVFGWPGLGQLMLEALGARDFFLVVDSAVLATAFFLLGTLIADILLYLADPRIRAD